ncbi:MAG: low molecular weight protein-tyrosine-phosphatase [Candidatus Limiplasma sp.]|nr:low molecular weight protein-tyrosine-phosphatase [Candidatus Limiplasma sp.]
MKRILFVCHGNICRSPMAEFVMRDLLEKQGIHDIETASAATSSEEIGNPVHPGTRRKLAEHGIRCDGKTACRLTRADYAHYDLIIGMDAYNLRNMQTLFGGDPDHKLHKLLSFCGEGGDVADPWYTGDFEQTWQDISRGCQALMDHLTTKTDRRLHL